MYVTSCLSHVTTIRYNRYIKASVNVCESFRHRRGKLHTGSSPVSFQFAVLKWYRYLKESSLGRFITDIWKKCLVLISSKLKKKCRLFYLIVHAKTFSLTLHAKREYPTSTLRLSGSFFFFFGFGFFSGGGGVFWGGFCCFFFVGFVINLKYIR